MTPASAPDPKEPRADASNGGSVTAEAALGELGALMLDAGYAVTDVGHMLRAAVRARDPSAPPARVGVFPAGVLVQTSAAGGAFLSQASGAALTFDQVGRVGRLVAAAERGRLDWRSLAQHVEAVYAVSNRRGPTTAVAGNGLIAGGIAVVFGAPWWSVLADAALGLVIGLGLVGLARVARVAQLLPFLGAFVVTLALWWTSTTFGLGPVPLFAVCAPLVVLIPGATVTNAVLELSGGDLVSGGGRFISGIVVWALLASGVVAGMWVSGGEIRGSVIVAAGSVPPAGPATASVGAWAAVPDAWIAWPATLAVGVGIGLLFSASARLTAVVVLTLLGTFAVFAATRAWAGPVVGAGIAAAIVLVATRVLEARRPLYPFVVVFRPAWWLLVPGSFGLVAVTSAADASGDFLATTVGTVVALTVGTQVGALVVETGESFVRRRRRREVTGA